MNNPKKKPKQFLNLPTYPGGKKAFAAYVDQHIQYPEEAIAANVEGDVILTYEVTDNGDIVNPKVKHGIGYGCDQEALRLISGLQFSKTQNRGVRVRSKFTTRIPFRLPRKEVPTSIQYHITPSDPKETSQPQSSEKTGYTWQINVNPET